MTKYTQSVISLKVIWYITLNNMNYPVNQKNRKNSGILVLLCAGHTYVKPDTPKLLDTNNPNVCSS